MVLVLVAGLAVSGFLYATGRLGIGPLSAADEDAADTIAIEAPAPEWADDAQRQCAADELLSERRSGALADSGLIEEDDSADRGWAYTGQWDDEDATTYLTALLDCGDDWAAQVGSAWQLDDTGCLSDLGPGAVAGFLAVDTLGLDSESATATAGDTVAALDECYADDVTAPTGTARPAYRAVRFSFGSTDVPNAVATVTVDVGDQSRTLTGGTLRADAGEGGVEVCVTAHVDATYAWGTTRSAEQESCGTSKPKRLYWKKLDSCVDTSSGPCNSWELWFEGFGSYDTVSATLRQNGGDCASASGQCTFSVTASSTGRGQIVTWSAPLSWDELFDAVIGKLRAVLDN
ncbi:hypothetical protein [Nocardioides sp. YIM 152588]|uniref:hypothetical protein n=1 Tax=Nocardioides sp. YIM 152588 TaxID=3158259 RepID=UPI0032E3EE0E